MYVLPETIKSKFNELFDAIHYATDDLKIAGAEANLDGDFSEVAVINDTCRQLQALESDIKSVLNNFEAKPKAGITVKQTPSKKVENRARKPGGHLRVRLADEIIEKQTIADTFVETLKVFGLEQVAMLKKLISGAPLLAKSPTNGYHSQRLVGNWYVTTHINKQNASKLLYEIGKELNIPIHIEIVER
jgi:hypothetical protein